MRGERLSWRSACLSMSGRRHGSRVNEDAYLDWPDIGAWAVADGMGGHARGEQASRMVIEALSGALRAAPGNSAGDDRRGRILAALTLCNQALLDLGQRLDPPSIMGSTVAGLVIEGDTARLFWVGDSRLYLLRGRALHQVTQDHARLVPWADPARPDKPARMRQVLTQAIGAQPGLDVATLDLHLEADDRLLLCTDGFYKHIDDRAIAEHLNRPIARMADALWRDIARQGAADDTTFIAIERHRLGSG